MKYALFVFCIFTVPSILIADDAILDSSTPKLNTTPTFGKTELHIKETRRSTGPGFGADKTKVLDFDGNDAFAAKKPPEPKPMPEFVWTEPEKPRPVYDLRRKEDVETVF